MLFVVHHERDEFGSARGVEFLEDPVEVGFDGMLAQDKLVRDFLVRTALAHIFNNLLLSGGNAV